MLGGGAMEEIDLPPPVPIAAASHLQSAAATTAAAARPNETIMQITGRSTVTGHTSLVHVVTPQFACYAV